MRVVADEPVEENVQAVDFRAGQSFGEEQVSTVPTAVPPISVYAIDPQKTEKVRGMKANTAARAVRTTGHDR